MLGRHEGLATVLLDLRGCTRPLLNIQAAATLPRTWVAVFGHTTDRLWPVRIATGRGSAPGQMLCRGGIRYLAPAFCFWCRRAASLWGS